MKFCFDNSDVGVRINISDITLLDEQEAEYLVPPVKRRNEEAWWLRSSDKADRNLYLVSRDGTIAKKNSPYLELGVRPALRFRCNADVHAGDTLSVGNEDWTVLMTSAVSDSIALCNRVVGLSRYDSSRVVSTDFEGTSIKEFVNEWAMDRGIFPTTLFQELNFMM